MKNKRLIVKIESLLNKTPHYGFIIIFLTVFLMILSTILAKSTGEVIYNSIDPVTLNKTQNVFELQNYLSLEVFFRLLNNGLLNFSGMSSVVMVLVTVMAFGVAEKSGFLYTFFKNLLFHVPKPIVTVSLVTVAILGNVTSTGTLNAGNIVLLPLSAFIYLGNDRNPLAGIAAVFASIFGAYTINILLTADVFLLNSITASITRETLEGYTLVTSSDRTLMFALVIGTVVTISLLTEKYIIKILPVYELHLFTYHKITVNEKRGFLAALIVTAAIVLTYGYWITPKTIIDAPGSGILLGEYNPTTTTYITQLLRSPFISYFIIHVSYLLIVSGSVYGLVSKRFKSVSDIIKSSVVAIADHAEYFVLAFIVSQFIFVLYDSNLSLYFLLKLTDMVKDGSVFTMITILIIITAIANLLVPSSATKWSVMAPIIIPIFISASVNPIVAKSAFQIGESITNTLSPVMPYTIFTYTLFDIYAKKTKQHCGNGTYFKLTVPYSIILGIVLTIIILVFILLNIPLGSGTNIYL